MMHADIKNTRIYAEIRFTDLSHVQTAYFISRSLISDNTPQIKADVQKSDSKISEKNVPRSVSFLFDSDKISTVIATADDILMNVETAWRVFQTVQDEL